MEFTGSVLVVSPDPIREAMGIDTPLAVASLFRRFGSAAFTSASKVLKADQSRHMNNTPGIFQQLLGENFIWLFRESIAWTILGLIGNILFSSRFLVQWVLSEKHQRVVVPPVFWHLSFWGSVVSLVYALHVDKLPVILAYLFLPFLYARNLVLLRRTGMGRETLP